MERSLNVKMDYHLENNKNDNSITGNYRNRY